LGRRLLSGLVWIDEWPISASTGVRVLVPFDPHWSLLNFGVVPFPMEPERAVRIESAFFIGAGPMKKVEDYKRQAAECRAMARVAANEEQRQGLLAMAETWDGLAENRATQVERQKRIDALDQPSG
jgi:hypothetical protein